MNHKVLEIYRMQLALAEKYARIWQKNWSIYTTPVNSRDDEYV